MITFFDILDIDVDQKVAQCQDAYNVVVSEQIITRTRGFETLEFDVPLANKIVPHLQPERKLYLYNNKRMYIIRTVTKTKAEQKICHVYCEALWYELLDHSYFSKPASDTIRYTLTQAVNQVLEGTGWTVGTVQSNDLHAYTIDQNTRLYVLKYISKVWGVEMHFDTVARTVSFYTDYGERTTDVYRFEPSGNVSTMSRTIDTQNLTTRIYMYGEDGITIADINGGFDYIEDYSWYDSQFATRVIKCYTIEDERFNDPEAMRAYMLEYLAIYSKPVITYEIELAVSEQKAGLGDYAYVQDYDLDIKIWTRIIEKETNYSEPQLSRAVFDSFVNGLFSEDDLDFN